MRVINAPQEYESFAEITCFMAGGMGNTEWHERFMHQLQKYKTPDLVIYNPYNANITSTFSQIQWEFKYLEACNIFSIYFDKYTDQPISMYELGCMLIKAQTNEIQIVHNGNLLGTLPQGGIPCVISMHEEAPKKEEIKIQCGLRHQLAVVRTPEQHADAVYKQYLLLKGEINETR